MRTLLVALGLLLAACSSPAPTPPPTPTPAATPMPAPAPTPAATPTPQATPKAPGAKKVSRWLGIYAGTVKDPIPGAPPQARCKIFHTTRGGPAHLAGLRADDVIIRSAGRPVTNRKDYIAGARETAVGEQLELVVLRDGQEVTASLTMGEKPPDMKAWRREAWPGTEILPWSNELLRPTGAPALGSDTAGDKVQLIYFWATWCGPCKVTAPLVQELYDEFPADKLQLVAVSSEERPAIEKYLSHDTRTYPIGWDPRGDTKRSYEVQKLPTIVLMADGKVVHRDVSVSGIRATVQQARELLKGR